MERPDDIPADQQPGHHSVAEQDEPDLDALAERLGVEGEAEHVTTTSDDGRDAMDTLRSMTATAREMAAPVAKLVHDGVSRAAHRLEERRSVVERVERLEQQVADLAQQLAEERTTR